MQIASADKEETYFFLVVTALAWREKWTLKYRKKMKI
jgi:hypothetical protein